MGNNANNQSALSNKILSSTGDFLTGAGMAGLNAPSFGLADKLITPDVDDQIAYQAGRVTVDTGILIISAAGTIIFGGGAVATAPTVAGPVVLGAAAVGTGAIAVTTFGRTVSDTIMLAQTVNQVNSNSGGAGNAPKLTAPEATEAAKKLGYQKTNETSHGQPVYYNPKTGKYITPDVDSHNGGVWKAADSVKDLGSKSTRLGTYDANLNRIGD